MGSIATIHDEDSRQSHEPHVFSRALLRRQRFEHSPSQLQSAPANLLQDLKRNASKSRALGASNSLSLRCSTHSRPSKGPGKALRGSKTRGAAPSRASSAAPGSSPAPLWEPRSLPRRCRWCASRSPPSGTCSPTCATPLYRLERPKTARKRLQNGRFGLAQACPGLLLVARNLELFTSICWFATARFSMISRSRTRSSGNSSSTSCMECACRDAAEALQKSL